MCLLVITLWLSPLSMFIYLFGVLRLFQHCTGHITTGTWKGRGNQYIQFVRVLYCKLPTNGKQLPAFPLEAVPGTEPRPQRWEARVLPHCHHDPLPLSIPLKNTCSTCRGKHSPPTGKGVVSWMNNPSPSYLPLFLVYRMWIWGLETYSVAFELSP